jgi:hypothetical protein
VSGYGILLPGYWDGETGRTIGRAGGSTAQLVGLYFTSNPDATMIGLYPAPLAIVQTRLRTLSLAEIQRAVWALGEAGFADYDVATEHVWIREMAKFRLGLYKGPISKKDNRAQGAIRLFERLLPNPFIRPFYQRYRDELHLPKPRPFKGDWERLGSPLEGASVEGASKPLPSPFQAASKPVTDNSDQRSLSRSQEDHQGDQDQRDAPRSLHDEARDAHRVLVRLAHDVLATGHASEPESERANRLKDLASAQRIAYDGREITKALESAAAQRRRSA